MSIVTTKVEKHSFQFSTFFHLRLSLKFLHFTAYGFSTLLAYDCLGIARLSLLK